MLTSKCKPEIDLPLLSKIRAEKKKKCPTYLKKKSAKMILIKKKIIAGHLNANSNFRELSTELKDKS